MRRVTIAVILMVSLLFLTASARADDAAALYKSKCMGCHAADGSGSPIGKKMGARDFRDLEVAKQTEQQITDVISKGKNKMSAYAGKLTADQIKELVSFIRDLQKKK